LFKKYGSIKAVADETGLRYDKVSQYVKYDQLFPELREMVDKREVNLQTALRAQKAASVGGEPDHAEAVALARGMAPLSGPQQKKVVEEREEEPEKPVEEILESAKSGGRITQVVVTLSSTVHSELKRYAEVEGTNLDDAARMLIESGLSGKGFLQE
jgi:ParB family chromosome partitioning protein